jgi:hypothetical protein
MNSIIVTRDGVIEKPILVKNNADSLYESIVRDLLGDDFDDVVGVFFDDMVYDRVNKYLEPLFMRIDYFKDLD